jgi:hypothetical protein
MPTKPLESLLYRELSKADAREVIEVASPLLQELVNYGTNLVARCMDSARGEENENFAVPMLYLHIIEMADGVECLIAQSCAEPAWPLIRSQLEALLAINYILEPGADYVQRSLSWLAAYAHNRISYYENLDPSTRNGQRYQQALASDVVMQRVTSPPTAQVQAAIANMQALLARPQFQAIEAEFQRLQARGRRHVQWYELFGGPQNLRMLARHLKQEARYDLLYGPLSAIAHAHDVSRFIGRTAQGESGLVRLRNPAAIRDVAKSAASYTMEATRLVLTKFRAGEKDAFAAWYMREVQERFLGL